MNTATLVIVWIATLLGGDSIVRERWIRIHIYLCQSESEKGEHTIELGKEGIVFICSEKEEEI